ncbi:MAG: hypothetical protein ACK44A_17665, partial [Roseateles sp.]
MSAPVAFDGLSVPLTDAEGRPRSRRAIRKDLTAARVVAAARFLFEFNGYFDSGIRDVAARIGMSVGAVFSVVKDKAHLWRLAFDGAAPPDTDVAYEVALIAALRPGWSWTLSAHNGAYRASLSPNGWNPLNNGGPFAVGKGDTPAAALYAVRIDADHKDP